MLLALAMGVCLGIGYLLPPGSGHNGEKALNGWEISMAITAACAVILLLIGRREKGKDILRRDAMGIVGIGWLVCSFFAALPYVICEPHLSLSAAYFEAVSGLTTTGTSVFNDLSSPPETILLWRSQTQWIGGMGILTMFVLVLSQLGASGRSLFQTESSAHMKEMTGTRMRETVKSLWVLYIVLTLICGAGLLLLGMTPFQAVNHSMATVSTGGFGTENDSLNSFGASIKIWILIFMLICSVSFPLYLVLLRRGRDWSLLRKHEETWGFAVIILVISIALIADRAIAGSLGDSFGEGALETVFNAVSVMTTTGFVVGDYDSWPALGKGLILFLMIIGGCAGSTSGGLKVSRLILWFKMLRIEIRRAYRPNEVIRLMLNGRAVPQGTRGQLFIILTSAAAVVTIGSYILVGLEPDKSVDGCVSAVISSVSNIGPAMNEFGPTQNFASLSPPSLVLLSIIMILGRLEYIAVLVLFSRTLWKRY